MNLDQTQSISIPPKKIWGVGLFSHLCTYTGVSKIWCLAMQECLLTFFLQLVNHYLASSKCFKKHACNTTLIVGPTQQHFQLVQTSDIPSLLLLYAVRSITGTILLHSRCLGGVHHLWRHLHSSHKHTRGHSEPEQERPHHRSNWVQCAI